MIAVLHAAYIYFFNEFVLLRSKKKIEGGIENTQ